MAWRSRTIKNWFLILWRSAYYVATVDCVSTKSKSKKRMAALRATILFLGFMSSYTWRQLYIAFITLVKYGFVSPPNAGKQTFVPRFLEKCYQPLLKGEAVK